MFGLLVGIYLEYNWAFILNYKIFSQLWQISFNSISIVSVTCFQVATLGKTMILNFVSSLIGLHIYHIFIF